MASVVGFGETAVVILLAIGPFLLVAGGALAVDPGTVVFELFARPGDRRDSALYGLAGFALAAAGTAVLAIEFYLPMPIYVGTVLLLSVGNLTGQATRHWWGDPFRATAGFVAGGFLAGSAAQVVAASVTSVAVDWEMVAFLAASGSLLAALLREALFKRDDVLVMVSVALLLWFLGALPVEISTARIIVALAVTVVLGYASFALDTASLPGMLTGVLLGLLTIVLGSYGWFAMLIAFFGIGGLASKYRYDRKLDRGIAEENEGARGTGNVLANSLVALFAVVGAAASQEVGVPKAVFFFAFAGAVGAALADTLSSEVGGLYDNPRLITTLRVVEPGTDGAVTWQGELVGACGAGIVAIIAFVTFDSVTATAAGAIVAAGVVGMTVDSLLGATIEGWLCGNQGVNFLATLAAAVAGAIIAATVGLTL
jgi:uncharacterized protein (TIGR00297 family)